MSDKESEDEASEESFQTHVECDGCDEEDRPVVWYCVTCKASVCDKCKSMKIHRSHKAKPWQDSEAIFARQNTPASCGDHLNEVIMTFCATCQVLCCALCVAEGHFRHNFSTIDEAFHSSLKNLAEALKMLQEFLPKTEAKISQIEDLKRKNQSRNEENLEKLRVKIEELNNGVTSMEKELSEKENSFLRIYMDPLNQQSQALMIQKRQINQIIAEIRKQMASPNKSRLIVESKRLSDVNRIRPLPLDPNLQQYPIFEITNFELPDADVCVGKYRCDEEKEISSSDYDLDQELYDDGEWVAGNEEKEKPSDYELDIKFYDDGEWEVWNGRRSKTTNVTIWRTVKKQIYDPAGLTALNILKECRHENIVRLLASYVHDEQLYFVTEKKSKAILRDYLREKGNKGIEFSLLMDFAFQIAHGMSFLESKDIIHRNLATHSVLISHDFTLRIGGIFQATEGKNLGSLKAYRFPIKWTAPEAVFYGEFSIKTDVWSIGVLLVEIVTYGQTPYPGITNRDVLDKIEHGFRHPKPAKCPDALYAIMLKCWDKQAVKRPTFEYLSGFFEDYLVSFEHEYDEIKG